MSSRNCKPIKLIYILASIIIYFFNTPTNIVTKDKQDSYKLSIVNCYEEIRPNTFILVDYTFRKSVPKMMKKCLSYGNVAYLKINDLSKAKVFTDLGFDKLEGIYYFKNSKQIYDILNNKVLNNKSKQVQHLNPWDVYILSKIFEVRTYLMRVGLSRNCTTLILDIGLRTLLDSIKN
ncbi:hypothetical protein P3W45_000314 [Vairimorpha bombi]|jgi:hypothetical protein